MSGHRQPIPARASVGKMAVPHAGLASAVGWGGNVTRTTMLMAFLIALLAAGGWAFGGSSGMAVMAGVGLAMNFLSYWFSDRLALMTNRAKPVTEQEAPDLHRVVSLLSQRAEMPMPRLYVIPSATPNAFATGRGPRHAAVAVTAGLLDLVDERELAAVLGHELSHVRNRDILIGTVAAGIAGVISSIGYVLRWGLLFGGGRRDQRGASSAAIGWIVVAPIVALLLQLAISRTREYAADAAGARLSGDPEALAAALEKLEAWSKRRPYEFAGPATAHLFIVNPLRGGAARILNLLSTHPPLEERVARLRQLELP